MRTAVSLLTLAFFAPIATGCISNEYVIPREELYRLTTIPPDVRGQQVHVIQDLGSRRNYAVPTDGPNWPQSEPWPEPAPPSEEERDTDPDITLNPNIDVYVGPDGGYASGGYGRPRTAAGTPRTAGGARAANWRGGSPSGGGIRG